MGGGGGGRRWAVFGVSAPSSLCGLSASGEQFLDCLSSSKSLNENDFILCFIELITYIKKNYSTLIGREQCSSSVKPVQKVSHQCKLHIVILNYN